MIINILNKLKNNLNKERDLLANDKSQEDVIKNSIKVIMEEKSSKPQNIVSEERLGRLKTNLVQIDNNKKFQQNIIDRLHTSIEKVTQILHSLEKHESEVYKLTKDIINIENKSGDELKIKEPPITHLTGQESVVVNKVKDQLVVANKNLLNKTALAESLNLEATKAKNDANKELDVNVKNALIAKANNLQSTADNVKKEADAFQKSILKQQEAINQIANFQFELENLNTQNSSLTNSLKNIIAESESTTDPMTRRVLAEKIGSLNNSLLKVRLDMDNKRNLIQNVADSEMQGVVKNQIAAQHDLELKEQNNIKLALAEAEILQKLQTNQQAQTKKAIDAQILAEKALKEQIQLQQKQLLLLNQQKVQAETLAKSISNLQIQASQQKGPAAVAIQQEITALITKQNQVNNQLSQQEKLVALVQSETEAKVAQVNLANNTVNKAKADQQEISAKVSEAIQKAQIFQEELASTQSSQKLLQEQALQSLLAKQELNKVQKALSEQKALQLAQTQILNNQKANLETITQNINIIVAEAQTATGPQKAALQQKIASLVSQQEAVIVKLNAQESLVLTINDEIKNKIDQISSIKAVVNAPLISAQVNQAKEELVTQQKALAQQKQQQNLQTEIISKTVAEAEKVSNIINQVKTELAQASGPAKVALQDKLNALNAQETAINNNLATQQKVLSNIKAEVEAKISQIAAVKNIIASPPSANSAAVQVQNLNKQISAQEQALLNAQKTLKTENDKLINFNAELPKVIAKITDLNNKLKKTTKPAEQQVIKKDITTAKTSQSKLDKDIKAQKDVIKKAEAEVNKLTLALKTNNSKATVLASITKAPAAKGKTTAPPKGKTTAPPKASAKK